MTGRAVETADYYVRMRKSVDKFKVRETRESVRANSRAAKNIDMAMDSMITQNRPPRLGGASQSGTAVVLVSAAIGFSLDTVDDPSFKLPMLGVSIE